MWLHSYISKDRKAAARMPLLISALAFTCTCSGCGNSDVPAAPSDQGAVSAADQRAIETVVNQFTTDIKRGKGSKAEDLMTLAFAKRLPSTALQDKTNDTVKPFLTATQFQYDSFQNVPKHKQVFVRCHFIGSDSLIYRTNFVMQEISSTWKIDSMLRPEPPRKLITPGNATTKPSVP